MITTIVFGIIPLIVTAAAIVAFAIAAALLITFFAASLAAIIAGALTGTFVPNRVRHQVKKLDGFDWVIAPDNQPSRMPSLRRPFRLIPGLEKTDSFSSNSWVELIPLDHFKHQRNESSTREAKTD
jgi:hypothetical protein